MKKYDVKLFINDELFIENEFNFKTDIFTKRREIDIVIDDLNEKVNFFIQNDEFTEKDKINKIKNLFIKAVNLLTEFKKDNSSITYKENISEIEDILSNFGSLDKDDGGIFSQLNYMLEDLDE